MSNAIKTQLVAVVLFLVLVIPAASKDSARPGFLEGHLRIISPMTVDLADGKVPTVTVETYLQYPLVVLSSDTKKEIARVTADKGGNYRIALPPGDYILDAHRRPRGRMRAKPQPFRITSDQTSRVDIDVDTGIR